MCLVSFLRLSKLYENTTHSQPCFKSSGTSSAYSHFLLQLFLVDALPVHLLRQVFSSPNFHTIFGSFCCLICWSLLGNFWVNFCVLFSYFFPLVFALRFYRFWEPFWLHFCIILASETHPGGTRTGKGRPSILNNTPMKIMVFRFWGCPGAPKTAPGSI